MRAARRFGASAPRRACEAIARRGRVEAAQFVALVASLVRRPGAVWAQCQQHAIRPDTVRRRVSACRLVRPCAMAPLFSVVWCMPCRAIRSETHSIGRIDACAARAAGARSRDPRIRFRASVCVRSQSVCAFARGVSQVSARNKSPLQNLLSTCDSSLRDCIV